MLSTPPVSVTVGPQHGCVLTKEELKEVWGDLDRIVKPSWMTSVPRTLSSSGPKLKSDQWRAVGSLYLPITLMRIWGKATQGGEEDVHRRRELLHLTMLLFSAIAIATSREINKTNTEEYLANMLEYRRELERIFPDYKIHPNHHLALHIPEFLQRYGPVHGWWTFPFERAIGMLEKVPTNYKRGKPYGFAFGRNPEQN